MSDINVIVNDEIVNIDVIDEPVLVNVVNSPGVPGAPGQGVPVGGTTGQVLAKNSATNYDTEWVDVTGGAWGTITGTLSNQTDLQTALDAKFDDPTGTTSQYLRGDGSLATFPSLTGFVPYTGATGDVDLGTHRILAQNATIASSGSSDTATITHSSGSGVGLNITKGGNGEGLYINKTSGSGNAATIIGTINATTLVKSGGTSSQFLKADGTVDSSVYVPTSRELTINGVTYDLSANRSWTVSAGISGSGAAGQVSYWDGTTSQAGSNNLFWDNSNGRLGIGTNAPAQILDILGTGNVLAKIKTSTSTAAAAYTAFNDANASFEFGMWGSTRTAFGAIGTGNAYLYGSVDFAITTLANIKFGTGAGTPVERMRLYSTGNLLIQSGGTFTDGGQRLQVQGTTLLNGNVTFSSATGMTWDAANSRLGIGTNAPATILDISSNGGRLRFSQTIAGSIFHGIEFATSGVAYASLLGNQNTGEVRLTTAASYFPTFYASGSEGMRLTTNRNLILQNGGTFTDSGERLQVTGNVKIVGSGATSGTNALRVLNSSSTVLLNVKNDGELELGAGGWLTVRASGQRYIYRSINATGALSIAADSNFKSQIDFYGSSHATKPSTISVASTFNPASGSTTFAALEILATINQTGTANGITRGLYVNPTLTAAADFRAIETARGNVVFGNLPTSPVGLPTGAIWNNLGMINIV